MASHWVPEATLFSWVEVIMFPSCVLLITRNRAYFILTNIIQVIYLNLLIKNDLLSQLIQCGENSFITMMINVSNIMATIYFVIILVLGSTLKKAQKSREEARRLEYVLDKQKAFLHNISHELRNPLNVVIGSIQTALSEKLPDEIRELLDTAHIGGELLLHLINNILDSGKLEVGDLEIQPVNINIRESIEQSWRICSELIKKKNINGYLALAGNVPTTLKLDPYRLSQILLNLVGNAVKFTQKGLVSIEIKWLDIASINEDCFKVPDELKDDEEGPFGSRPLVCDTKKFGILNFERLTFSNSVRSNMVNGSEGVLKISVRDTGTGMDQSSLQKLFKRFSQVGNDPSQRQSGTGLGLFITKSLSNKMEGDIRAFSQKGVGSCFIVCIPTEGIRSESPETPMNLCSYKEKIQQAKLNVLVADDDEFNVRAIKNYLTSIGINRIRTASHGKELLNLYQEITQKGERVDIILLDYNMPYIDGKSFAERVRKIEKEKKLKPALIIMISGVLEDDEAYILLESGIIDLFLPKPASFNRITNYLIAKWAR